VDISEWVKGARHAPQEGNKESDMMPTKKQIDAILPYLDRFTGEEFSGGTWHIPPGQFPWFDFSESVSEFHQALYDHGWIVPFDWGAWQETAMEYVENPEKIGSADAETIQKLFMTHIRKERFCEGHLVAMFENGHILHLLRRLREIADSLEKEQYSSKKAKE
jgi:hypothetical protein